MRSAIAAGFVVFFSLFLLFLFPLFPQLLFSQADAPSLLRFAQKAGDASFSAEKAAVENVLRTQQDAWNRHDLEGFMAGYWNSPELTFFSGATEHNGWQATLDRYRAAYASPGHEMGKLEFSGLRIEVLSADGAFARGSWHLTMPDGKTPHGLFTLVFRKFPEGWKIVHDHTSAAE
ncbi:MAG TPA: nuclear transport factor 2 family protein [Candidatus Sulfotelmatobacter sp.]